MQHFGRVMAALLTVGPLALGSDGTTTQAKKHAAPSVAGARIQKHGRGAKRASLEPNPRPHGRRATEQRRSGHMPSRGSPPAARPLEILATSIECPTDMVAVAGRVCVDRYEMSLEDKSSHDTWPPYFTPDLARAQTIADEYRSRQRNALVGSLDRDLEVPASPERAIDPLAVSKSRVLPQGYMSANQAEGACEAVGKRLCTEEEWVTACRGDEQRDFPYGDRYEQGACNVYRESHPSFLLHGNAARYHDDPRNNLVEFEGAPLLRQTGATPRCASRWGHDAIYDMVGNLDEWVADASGVFVGGFYSRGTRSGCASRVSAHPRVYSDYSTGARCCRAPL